jgi:hypothetical protein
MDGVAGSRAVLVVPVSMRRTWVHSPEAAEVGIGMPRGSADSLVWLAVPVS